MWTHMCKINDDDDDDDDDDNDVDDARLQLVAVVLNKSKKPVSCSGTKQIQKTKAFFLTFIQCNVLLSNS